MRLGNLIGELHRRSVFQVVGSYAVVAWIILQLAETLEGLIGLPLWFGPAIVVVVLLGFPVFLITALTQGGDRRSSEEVPRGEEEGDWSISHWRHLERRPVLDALGYVFTWRNALVGGAVMAVLLALGAAGYSGLRSAGIGPLGSLVAKGVFESNERLILSDFENRTDDGTLGETVTSLFRIDLSQSASVRLLDRTELIQALPRMQLDPNAAVTFDVALELAEREGVKAVVAGEVLPLGPGAVVSARLVAAPSGETLWAMRETARTIDAVPDAVDRLSAQMRVRIGESLRSIQGDPPLEEVTTGSIEALRKYVQSEWAMEMGDTETAEGLIKEAIALDSTFAMAHRKLGVLLSNESRNPEEAREAFTRAFEERDRLSDRERYLAEAAYHTYVTEDLDAAVEAYERVLSVYPSDGIAANNLAVLYGERQELDKAAGLYLAAIERGRAPVIAYTNAAFTLFRLGKVDSASAVLDQLRGMYPEHPQAMQYAAAFASARFDYARAEGLVRDLVETHPENARMRVWGEAELASYALVRGKLNEGVERMLRAYGLQNEGGGRFTELRRVVFEALNTATVQRYLLEDPAGAASILEQAVSSEAFRALPPEERGWPELASLFASAGRPDRAREALEVFLREVPDGASKGTDQKGAVRAAEAAAALAEGRVEESLGLYREARSLAAECDLCWLPEMGEAFEAAALPDSAMATYEGYLRAPVLFRSQDDDVNLHRVLLGLGRSHEGLGETELAIRYYRRLLDLWSEADPGMQPRVERLRRRVEGLGGDAPG
ncbi:MAG: tetratricopeptide repeat protein [Longimicrobiales bacterium]